MKVTFMGVRGTVPCPTYDHLKYGGNTSCVLVEGGGRHILLDAGTGIRAAGTALLKQGVTATSILLTHVHHDHINGFPFFAPLYSPTSQVSIMAGSLSTADGIRGALSTYMAPPLFPLPLRNLAADLNYVDFRAGEQFQLGDGIAVRTCALNHPDGATGYRIDCDGASLAYITDTEHVPGRPDENVLNLIDGCDLLIYDSTYTEEQFASKIGWGHSTWSEGVRLSIAARVKRLALFHHEPMHDDARLAAIEAEAQAQWTGVFAAREGESLLLGSP